MSNMTKFVTKQKISDLLYLFIFQLTEGIPVPFNKIGKDNKHSSAIWCVIRVEHLMRIS